MSIATQIVCRLSPEDQGMCMDDEDEVGEEEIETSEEKEGIVFDFIGPVNARSSKKAGWCCVPESCVDVLIE